MKEDMRGLFFIVKGQYKKGVKPTFNYNGDTSYIGGYDPTHTDTTNWYQCIDRVTYTCISCGSDLEKVVGGVYCAIIRHKDLRHYRRAIDKMESARVSPFMVQQRQAIDMVFGDHFEHLIRREEDRAYDELKGKSTFRKVKTKVTPTPPPIPTPLDTAPPPTPLVTPRTLKNRKMATFKKLTV